MPSRFRIQTTTDAPREALFDASLSIDAHVASMAWSGEEAVGGVTTGRIGLGEYVTWRARHLGVRFRMTSRISALERPRRFVDEQIRGPFRLFSHEHVFEEVGGRTLMTDTLTVASSVFGRLAERWVLVPYLRRLLRIRNAAVVSSLGARILPSCLTRPAASRWMATPGRYRRHEHTAVVGQGDAQWEAAAAAVLHWAVKTRSGFDVRPAARVQVGDRPLVIARLGVLRVREPVEVVEVVDRPDRVGFAYRTLPGHPLRGEEAFILSRSGDAICLTVRSLTRPAPTPGWFLLYPLLRVAQIVVRGRYRRSLLDAQPPLPRGPHTLGWKASRKERP